MRRTFAAVKRGGIPPRPCKWIRVPHAEDRRPVCLIDKIKNTLSAKASCKKTGWENVSGDTLRMESSRYVYATNLPAGIHQHPFKLFLRVRRLLPKNVKGPRSASRTSH